MGFHPMKYEPRWSALALQDLLSLPRISADRITKKTLWFAEQKNPLSFAKVLGGRYDGVYRFRVGDYRVLFEVFPDRCISILMVLRVKHRRDAYE